MSRLVRVIIFVVVLVVAGCAGPSRLQVRLGPQVDSQVEPTVANSIDRQQPLRIAVASVLSPTETFRSYHDLIQYLGGRVGRPVEFVQRSTYAEVNALVRAGKVDVAFVCTLAYVEGRRELAMELLASPVFRGRPEYYSLVIVPADSLAQSLQDLRGGVFAYADPMSNSGWLAPTYALAQLGQTPDAFFRRTIYTYSHDNSIRAVADHLVDGAAVDSLVYDSSVERKPELKRRLRIVDRFGPYATPPVVASLSLNWERKAELRAALLSMHEDPDGRRILADLGIDQFISLSDSAYDSIRVMRNAVHLDEQARP